MAPRIWLKFDDGSVETVAQTPRALITVERKWGSMDAAPRIEATFYTAYIALKVTGESFDDWVNRIVDFAELEEGVDPPPAASDAAPDGAMSADAPPTSP